jgi:PAS domain-containing protein
MLNMNTQSREPRPLVNLRLSDRVPTAELVIYDPAAGKLASGVGELAMDLPPGAYEIESVVGGDRLRRFVVLNPGQPEDIYFERQFLDFASAAPIEGTSTSREWHMEFAYKWSTQATMPPPLPEANAALFVFVRTIEPELFKDTYDENLALLDADGQTLCDFRAGVEREPDNGWTALNVELPAGFYMLRRGGRGHPARNQPVWLSQGYATQVFIPARHEPMLGDMALFMSMWGSSFSPSDEAHLATETVLHGLRHGRNLANSEQMRFLLTGKFHNPWLGILALHAMRLSPPSERNLWGIVAGNTHNMLGDHPDLIAALLKPSDIPAKPFEYPPMLSASLRIIREQASQMEGVIAPGSLASRILDGLITDSDWVAWRTLPPVKRSFDFSAQPPARSRKSAGQTRSLWGGEHLSWSSPSAESDDEAVEPDFSELFAHPDTPEDNPLLAELLALAETIPFGSRTGAVSHTLDVRARLDPALAGSISQRLNLPIDKVRRALERLHANPQLMSAPHMMTDTEKAVAEWAWKEHSPRRDFQSQEERGGEVENLSSVMSDLDQVRHALNNLERRLASYPSQAGGQHLAEAQRMVAEFGERMEGHQPAVLVIDADYQPVYANPGFERLLEMARTSSKTGEASLYPVINRLKDEIGSIDLPLSSGSAREYSGVPYAYHRLLVVDAESGKLGATILRLRPLGVPSLSPADISSIRRRLHNLSLTASLAMYAPPADQDAHLAKVRREAEGLMP